MQSILLPLLADSLHEGVRVPVVDLPDVTPSAGDGGESDEPVQLVAAQLASDPVEVGGSIHFGCAAFLECLWGLVLE